MVSAAVPAVCAGRQCGHNTGYGAVSAQLPPGRCTAPEGWFGRAEASLPTPPAASVLEPVTHARSTPRCAAASAASSGFRSRTSPTSRPGCDGLRRVPEVSPAAPRHRSCTVPPPSPERGLRRCGCASAWWRPCLPSKGYAIPPAPRTPTVSQVPWTTAEITEHAARREFSRVVAPQSWDGARLRA